GEQHPGAADRHGRGVDEQHSLVGCRQLSRHARPWAWHPRVGYARLASQLMDARAKPWAKPWHDEWSPAARPGLNRRNHASIAAARPFHRSRPRQGDGEACAGDAAIVVGAVAGDDLPAMRLDD